MNESPQPSVSLENVTHRYDGVLALDRISIQIPTGSFSAILGPNGAGKTTLAMIMGGMLRPSSGRICINGSDRTRLDSGRGFIKRGVILVPEGRRLFTELTVRENLLLGAYGAGKKKSQIDQKFEQVMQLLPELKNRPEQHAGTLSGGEQQLLALGRGLMAEPSVVILDEPSLGLAPLIIERIYEIISDLNDQSVTVVVIEQMAAHAMRYAENMIILEQGRIYYQGSVTSESATEALKAGYLGRHS